MPDVVDLNIVVYWPGLCILNDMLSGVSIIWLKCLLQTLIHLILITSSFMESMREYGFRSPHVIVFIVLYQCTVVRLFLRIKQTNKYLTNI